jgi:putative N6-adenine-specific DNA methylase
MSSLPSPPYDAFAISAPGLEQLTARELTPLGVRDVRATEGGVTFTATAEQLYAANLHLRTASRVIVRAGAFGATAFHELERRAGKVPWETFIAPNLDVSIRVTCRKSRLYHSDAVAERVARAIESRVRGAKVVDDPGDESDVPNQLVIVRLFHDRCIVSIDSSGALLHRRGYRQAVAKAPIRETLAAAALIASGWRADAPLADPMCGSGTIPIEAALMARRIPPGLDRRFAFEHWAGFDRAVWQSTLDSARAAVLPSAPKPIFGSDRDAGAIEAAQSNAERAGVANDVQFAVRPVSALAMDEPGWVVANPPYGVRVGESEGLRNLYAQLGNVLRERCRGSRIALISADPGLERQLRLRLRPLVATSNGGIKVRVIAGEVPL